MKNDLETQWGSEAIDSQGQKTKKKFDLFWKMKYKVKIISKKNGLKMRFSLILLKILIFMDYF